MITFILVIAASYLGFEVGRRVERGVRERRVKQRPALVGRRGTMRLKPMKIRR